MEVRVSGAVMASLMLELANGKGDVEGFLLGDITGRTVNTISDSESEHLRYERIATIHGFLPCNKVFSFYDGIGRIDKKKLGCLLKDSKESIIGWYKYRRNSQPLVTLRERFVHHNLIEELGFEPSQEFLFAVITSSSSSGRSTHLFNYSMLSASHVKSPFNSHELNIVNLGDTSHSEYRLGPHTVRTTSKVFSDVVNVYRDDFIDKNGCLQQSLAAHGMCIALMTKMKDLVEDVKNSEYTVCAMAEQVETLRGELDNRRKELQRQTEQTRMAERQAQQTTSSETISTQAIKEHKSKETSISCDDDDIRIVEGAEAWNKNITQAPMQSSQVHVDSKTEGLEKCANDTDTAMDVSSTVSGKVRVSCVVSEYTTLDKEDNEPTVNGGLLNGPYADDANDDETLDFSLPEDDGSDEFTKSQDQTLTESLSPQY